MLHDDVCYNNEGYNSSKYKYHWYNYSNNKGKITSTSCMEYIESVNESVLKDYRIQVVYGITLQLIT